MLFVVGASDGGGAGDGGLSWLSLLLSTIAVLFTLITIIVNARKAVREDVWKYLLLLTSKEVAQSRAVVARAARVRPSVARAKALQASGNPRLSLADRNRGIGLRDEVDGYRDAAFELMWVIALAPMAVPVRTAKQGPRWTTLLMGRSVDAERAQVYWHLRLIVAELRDMLKIWGEAFDWADSGARANEVLAVLPETLPDPIGGEAKRPGDFLPLLQEPTTFPGTGTMVIISRPPDWLSKSPSHPLEVFVGNDPSEDRPTKAEAEEHWKEIARLAEEKDRREAEAARFDSDPEYAREVIETAGRSLIQSPQSAEEPGEDHERDS